jgi:hypothetical protein
MKSVVDELEAIVKDFTAKFTGISEDEFSLKPTTTKWSRKEVLGHLIDSGENNLRRFICGQYETPPPKIKYDQDFWVSVNSYQQMPTKDVIENWRIINTKICNVLGQMPVENYNKVCDFGDGKLLTLQWLAIDYVKHLKHHLNQIIPKSFDIVYP